MMHDDMSPDAASPELCVGDATPSPVRGAAPWELYHGLLMLKGLVRGAKQALLAHKLHTAKALRMQGRYQEEVVRQVVECCKDLAVRERESPAVHQPDPAPPAREDSFTYRRQGSDKHGSICKREGSDGAAGSTRGGSLSMGELAVLPAAQHGRRGYGSHGPTEHRGTEVQEHREHKDYRGVRDGGDDKGPRLSPSAPAAASRLHTGEPNVVVCACVNETAEVKASPGRGGSAFTAVPPTETPPLREVVVHQGRGTRRFAFDSVVPFPSSVAEQTRGVLDKLKRGTSCCVGVVADGAALGQQHALNLVHVLASSLPAVTPHPVEARAALVDGEQYQDAFKRGKQGWYSLEARGLIPSLHPLPLRDTQGVKAALGVLSTQRTQRKGAAMVVHLRVVGTPPVDLTLLDFCTSAAPPDAPPARGRCRQVPPARQVFCDVLASMRARNPHHPVRSAKLTAQLADVCFKPDVHHVLCVGVGLAPERVAAVSDALRVLHTATRVCGNAYVLRPD